MSYIKMSDVFGGRVSVYDYCMLKAKGCKVASVSRGHAKHIANAINSHDSLVFDLDNARIYIADADMKNEGLTKEVAELRAALGDVLIEYQGLGGCEVLIDQCAKALESAK